MLLTELKRAEIKGSKSKLANSNTIEKIYVKSITKKIQNILFDLTEKKIEDYF